MVTCSLIGRLGNQAFQIATTLSYSLKHNMPYWIPRTSQAEHIWPAFFKHFPDQPKEHPERKYIEYKEKNHYYEEIPHYNNVRLSGFFQSEKYFSDYRQEIIDAFQIPYKKLEGFVSIHVRRGDYLQFTEKHPPVTYEYISAAVKHFIDLGFFSFVVCSDDIKWCRVQFKPLELFGAVFSYSAGHSPIEDLAMMSCCVHNIISNSSFSWWSAWLNQNPDKIVIAPKIWFGEGNKNLDDSDIVPESWIKM
jgi:hypothetical protein